MAPGTTTGNDYEAYKSYSELFTSNKPITKDEFIKIYNIEVY